MGYLLIRTGKGQTHEEGEYMEISDFAEKMTTPIHDFLVKNSESHTIRCYMPGHKGTEDPLDITEIDGADSLYDTDTNGGKGIIALSEKNASKLFGSKRTLYSAREVRLLYRQCSPLQS